MIISLAPRLQATFLLILAFFVALNSQAQLVNFKNNPYFYPIVYPNKLETADLNGDDILDIVVSGESRISVLKSDASGQYHIQNYLSSAWMVSLGNFNQDQEPDIAATEYDSLVVLFNSGNGSFSTSKQVIGYTGPSVGYPVVADFNNDGRDDIAVGNSLVSEVRVFLQTTTPGEFEAPTIYPAGSTTKMEKGDFDHDGSVDLVVLNNDDQTFTILFNAGNGTFQTPQPYSTLGHPTSIAIADVDRDDDLDFIVGNSTSTTPSSLNLYKNSHGIFSHSSSYPIDIEYMTAEFIAAGNINADDFPDITFVDWSKAEIRILYNDGTGDFDSTSTHALGGQPRAILTADLNQDGKTDMAIGNYSSIQTVMNQGNGSFQIEATGAGYPTGLAEGDFNNDGSPDIAVTNSNDRSISVMLNDTKAQFLTKKNYIVGHQPYSIKVADLNGDDVLDLVTANVEEDSIAILRGLRDGNFVLHKKFLVGNDPIDLVIHDFNSDERMDIMVLGTPITLFLNTGEDFQSSTVVGVYNMVKICAGDLNDDDAADFVVATASAYNNLWFFMNHGDGTFETPVALTSQFEVVNAIAISDFNEDDIQDIGYVGSSYFNILTNDGNAGFSRQVYTTQISDGKQLVTGDFDGNGKQDVAIGSIASNSVSVLVKNDAGGFHDPVLFQFSGGYLLSMTSANFDGDNKDDLAIGGWPNNYLSVWIALPRLQLFTPDVTREYGVDNPAFTGTVVGWPSSYNHSITFESNATILSPVGTYDIFPIVSDSIAENFAILKDNGILTIRPAPLTITALDTTRLYGDENPIFRSFITGLRNNDTFRYDLYTEAEQYSPPGKYPIYVFPKEASNINYSVTLVNGTLAIYEDIATVYPNPSDGHFYVYSLDTLSYVLVDSKGTQIQTGTFAVGESEIKLSVTPGLYLIRLQDGSSLKIVILK